MSKYTTQLRFVCEEKSGLDESVGYDSIATVLDNCYDKIFDFDYPIFDENYKPILEKKILKHFYTRELCEETYGLWKLRLDAKMNEIMPYYNQLYESELLEFNPLNDTDVTTTGTKQDNGSENNSENKTLTKTGTVSDEGSRDTKYGGNDVSNNATHNENDDRNDHWDYYSDTPQGTVQNLANLTYLTNARHITDSGAGSESDTTSNNITSYGKTSDTDIDNTKTYDTVDEEQGNRLKAIHNLNEYTEHVTGKRWADSYSELLTKFRNTFLNIDQLVLEELEELFFGLW